MKNKIISLFVLISLLLIPCLTNAEYWIYYWVNSNYSKKTLSKFDLMIIQPYNFDLYKNYKGKKICYITVWEFDWDQEELNSLDLQDATVWFNDEWNSFVMDMSNSKWQDYLLNQENKLKNLWCNWLFLDTIWNDWQELWWIEITKKLRQNWENAYIIPNNAHNIKNEIKDYVNGFMFENFWDVNIKDNSEDAKWLLSQMQEYTDIVKWTDKKLFAINYWNPFKNKKWWNKTKELSKKYWFEMIFSNYNLDKIEWYIDLNKSIIKKL